MDNIDDKIDKVQREIDALRFEIKRLEEEVKFLIDEQGRFFDMNIAKITHKVLNDPVALEVLRKELGEDFIRESKIEAEECLSGIPIEESHWQSSFNQMIDGIVALHEKQIANYTKMKSLAAEALIEHSHLSFEFGMLEESIDKSIEAYKKGIKRHIDSKETFRITK